MALGLRNRTDLADSVQFTVRTLADIEHGVRKASPGTYAMLENKLAWAPGSIDTIWTPTGSRGPRRRVHPLGDRCGDRRADGLVRLLRTVWAAAMR